MLADNRCMVRSILVSLAILALTACGAVPDGREPTRPRQSQAAIPTAPSGAISGNMCFAELGQTGAGFEPVPDRYYAPGCHTLGSVQIAGLASDRGRINLANIGPVACPVAQTLAGWARYGIDRAARQYLGSPIARIETMGSYSCRNVSGTTRLSAHSRAEAIDVAGFVLADGRRISVADDWYGGTKAERQFLRAVHASACKRFGTVLGPDYNLDHRDHFHLEGQGPTFCR